MHFHTAYKGRKKESIRFGSGLLPLRNCSLFAAWKIAVSDFCVESRLSAILHGYASIKILRLCLHNNYSNWHLATFQSWDAMLRQDKADIFIVFYKNVICRIAYNFLLRASHDVCDCKNFRRSRNGCLSNKQHSRRPCNHNLSWRRAGRHVPGGPDVNCIHNQTV